MRIAGVKATHDGAIALIHDGVLESSIEEEKLNNNARYSVLNDPWDRVQMLQLAGYDVSFDGWGRDIPFGETTEKDHEHMPHAGYYEMSFDNRDETSLGYKSYGHVLNHVTCAYSTSPFAKSKAPSLVYVMDGGMPLTAYLVDPNGLGKHIVKVGEVSFPFLGYLYGIMGRYFGPYKDIQTKPKGRMDFPGKIMGYIAKGDDAKAKSIVTNQISPNAMKMIGLFQTLNMPFRRGMAEPENMFCEMVKREVNELAVSDATIMLAIHYWMQNMIVDFVQLTSLRNPTIMNHCFVGGTFLNIKYNSAIRKRLERRGEVHRVWVPPFPNDSGSAIGAACTRMIHLYNEWHLEWDIFSGPSFQQNLKRESQLIRGKDLGELIIKEGLVGLVCCGKAELGPRALGHRSIVAPTSDVKFRDRINHVKGREEWRPVAPIALNSYLQEIGMRSAQSDEYMLYDHVASDRMKELHPAVVHLDGTCRIQSHKFTNEHHITNILKGAGGILCNTSANYNGSGFFYDEVTAWNFVKEKGLDFLYSSGDVYWNWNWTK